ncbi:hypothetical protein [Pseudomonas sp. BAY1663]|uniref:hypothetical protein n=1 Tax=Pseudomonas sp. BAY1663 TaxID=1439940 RepID=UPI000FFC2A5B|nr:hypothetical protein [Pseudomonas sp. BAY1663]
MRNILHSPIVDNPVDETLQGIACKGFGYLRNFLPGGVQDVAQLSVRWITNGFRRVRPIFITN